MEDMICPRCRTTLIVERVGRIIQITCPHCKYCSDTETNVRDAQQAFFKTIRVMDSIEVFRKWAEKNLS